MVLNLRSSRTVYRIFEERKKLIGINEESTYTAEKQWLTENGVKEPNFPANNDIMGKF